MRRGNTIFTRPLRAAETSGLCKREVVPPVEARYPENVQNGDFRKGSAVGTDIPTGGAASPNIHFGQKRPSRAPVERYATPIKLPGAQKGSRPFSGLRQGGIGASRRAACREGMPDAAPFDHDRAMNVRRRTFATAGAARIVRQPMSHPPVRHNVAFRRFAWPRNFRSGRKIRNCLAEYEADHIIRMES